MSAMVDDGPQLAPSLFAWVEHVCDWELNRREGLDFALVDAIVALLICGERKQLPPTA